MTKIRQVVKLDSFVLIDGFLFKVDEANNKHWKIIWENLPKKKAKRKAKVIKSYLWTRPKHFKSEVKKMGVVISENQAKEYQKTGI